MPGDIGHAAGFDFPVRYRTVRGASPQRVVREQDSLLLQPFIEAALGLIHDDGASAIATSCGFLVLFQQALQAALPVPVRTSSLLLLSDLQRSTVCGVVTVDSSALGADHLAAAGASASTPVEGLEPGCAFQRTLLEDRTALDENAARDSTVQAALRLVARCPQIDAIVLECTNMPPYADAVRAATGREVHDIGTMLRARFGQANEALA